MEANGGGDNVPSPPASSSASSSSSSTSEAPDSSYLYRSSHGVSIAPSNETPAVEISRSIIIAIVQIREALIRMASQLCRAKDGQEAP